ncbi:MAG: hypothetical protein IT320_24230 [Anaerolineae bacterium]|nr:hypothetical protein [Anaerolineae bacterium]
MLVLLFLLLLVLTGAIPLPVALFLLMFFGLFGVGFMTAVTPPATLF